MFWTVIKPSLAPFRPQIESPNETLGSSPPCPSFQLLLGGNRRHVDKENFGIAASVRLFDESCQGLLSVNGIVGHWLENQLRHHYLPGIATKPLAVLWIGALAVPGGYGQY